MFLKNLIISMCCVVFCTSASLSQSKVPDKRFYCSEAAVTNTDHLIVLSINNYRATDDEIKKAGSRSKDGSLTYLQIPVFSKNVTLFEQKFESSLYAFDENEKLLWTKPIASSKSSVPAPVVSDEKYIFTGGYDIEKKKLIIYKIDEAGNIMWQVSLDSLENLNALKILNNRLSLLASFEYTEQVNHPDSKTFSLKSFPVFFFIQLDPETGRLIKKEFQPMGSYLSSKDYVNPLLNTDFSYFLKNKDSLIFLTVMNQKTATVVSDEGSKSEILYNTADTAAYYYVSESGNGKKTYQLNGKNYSKDSFSFKAPVPFELKSEIPVADMKIIYQSADTTFLSCSEPWTDMHIYGFKKGNLFLKKETANPEKLLAVQAGIFKRKLYTIFLEGRKRNGESGSIKIVLNKQEL